MGTTDCVSNFSCDRNMLSTTASYCCSIDNSFRNYEAGIGIIILTIVPVLGELSSTPPDLPALAPAGPARPQATSEAGPGAGPRATPAPPPGGSPVVLLLDCSQFSPDDILESVTNVVLITVKSI